MAIELFRPEVSAMIGPERFLREIQVTVHLQHPLILPLLDSGDADGSSAHWKYYRAASRSGAVSL